MSDSSVEYNVVINGLLAGHKPEDVANLVAPILGIHADEALVLFNGVAHTVLQNVDLSAAASFQARLKDTGIDASVAVAADAPRKPAPAAEVSAPEEDASVEEAVQAESLETAEADAAEPESLEEQAAEPEAPQAVVAEPEAPEVVVAEPEAPEEVVAEASVPEEEVAEPAAPQEEAAEPEAPQEEAAEPAAPQEEAAEPEAPQEEATEPAAPEEEAAEPEAPQEEAAETEADATPAEPADESSNAPDIELDLSILEAAQRAATDEEPEDRLAALEDSPELQEKVRQREARRRKRAEREQLLDALEGEPEVVQVSKEMDLDEMFAEEEAAAAPENAPPAEPAPDKATAAEIARKEAAPVAKPEPPAPSVELVDEPAEEDADTGHPEPAIETEQIVVQAPDEDPSPGSNMLCPACHTLQPRAPQCRACGAMVADFEDSVAAKSKPRLPPRLSRKSVLWAAGAAVVGAGIWLGVAHGLDFKAGFPALLVGCLVGLTCGLTGGRGTRAGATSAGLAAVAIIVASLLMPKETPQELPAPPQPDPAEVWSDAEAPQRYKQSLDDAETFMTTDGSVRAIRAFMIQRSYTKATSPEQIPESDLRYFYDVDAPDLSWIVENQPDFKSWSQRMRGHLSGRQRVKLNVSAPPIEPVRAGITFLQLLLMVLGIAAAFGLAQAGLKRND